ncbi:hypothetical protein MRB53_041903 [Persea americana]|nr:hypothetical protein MRB53_041903 [Persea americana]
MSVHLKDAYLQPQLVRPGRPRRMRFLTAGVTATFALAAVYFTVSPHSHSISLRKSSRRVPQYMHIQHGEAAYTGDSYTTTHYQPKGEQPSVHNRFGNEGATSAAGLNWIQHLVYDLSTPGTLCYNFASSTATIERGIFTQPYPEVVAGVEQVGEWVDTVGYIEDAVRDDHLFIFWFGQNDAAFLTSLGMAGDNVVSHYHDTTGVLIRQFQELHSRGARNFLILGVGGQSSTDPP